MNYMKKDTVIQIAVVLFIIFILFLLFKYMQNKGHGNEHFAVCSNENKYTGNVQIRRDGSNLGFNPAKGKSEKVTSIILGSPGNGISGNKGDSVTINLNGLKRLYGLILAGYGSFNVDAEVFTANTGSWIPVLNSANEDDNKIFNGGNTDPTFTTLQNSKCFDIYADDVDTIICKRVRITIVSETAQYQTEVYAIESDSNPGYTDVEPLSGYGDLFDTDNNRIAKDSSGFFGWESSDTNPIATVRFTGSGSSGIVNKVIYYIEFTGMNNNWVTSFNISYKFIGSNIIRSESNILGNVNASEKIRYYFKYPILASELTIKPTSPESIGGAGTEKKLGCTFQLYGRVIKNTTDEETLKAEQETYYQMTSSKDKGATCPPITQLIDKQSEIQQLCQSLEKVDEIEMNKNKINQNKVYLMKLNKQKQEIKQLEELIDKMRTANKYYNEIDDRNKLAMYKYQQELDKKVKDLVVDRLNKQGVINMNLETNTTTTDAPATSNNAVVDVVEKFVSRRVMEPSKSFYSP